MDNTCDWWSWTLWVSLCWSWRWVTILLSANCNPLISTTRAAPVQCPLWQKSHDWEKGVATIDWETQPFHEEALTAGAPAELNEQNAFVHKVQVLEQTPIIKSTLCYEWKNFTESNTLLIFSPNHARLAQSWKAFLAQSKMKWNHFVAHLTE